MFELLGALNPAASSQFYIAHLWELANNVFYGPAVKKFPLNCLESLRKAETLLGKIRQDLSALPGVEAIQRKRLLSGSDLNQKIFQLLYQ